MGFFTQRKKTTKTNSRVRISISGPSTEELKAQYRVDYEKHKSEYEERRKKAKSEDNDTKFKRLSKSAEKNLLAGEIGFYRNDLFSIANILEKEGKLTDSLKQYLYIFYLDCTGISSLAAIHMGLTPNPSIIPGVANRIRILKKKLQISEDDLKQLYFSVPQDSIIPDTIFSFSEIYELLILWLNEKKDKANETIAKRVKKQKRK